MDGNRFDDLTRRLARPRSRRHLLTTLAGSVFGAAAAGAVGGEAAAGRLRSIGNSCARNSDCASGLCAQESRTRKICHCASAGDCPAPAASDVCHQAACLANGSCGIAVATGAPCDDGNPCTVNDVCQADGVCAGSPKNCPVTEPKCQSAVCETSTGDCVVTNAPAGTSCANDNRCDGDEACDANGVCVSGTPVSCAQLDGPCVTGVCDPATGQCAATNRSNGTVCADPLTQISGNCCNGLCSQCCGDASPCTSPPEANMAASCVTGLGGAQVCGYHCVPGGYHTCFNPSLTLTESCLEGPCLYCRLPVSAPCTDDAQCCGLCAGDHCEDGQPGSYCVDDGDCFSGLCDEANSVCVAPVLLGASCDPANDLCTAGTACGRVIGSGTDDVCCLAPDAACAADEDCCQPGGGERRCVLGTCTTRQGPNGACGRNLDCKTFLTCIDGTCGLPVGVGSACDNDGNCAFDSTSNSQPVCSGGFCRLPNGATCTDGSSCAFGTCVHCLNDTHICGECCTASTDGVDQFFCGDPWEKICCNHQCVSLITDTHCGACDLDCTCGGSEPQQYCARINDQNGDEESNATCQGSATNGHCARPLRSGGFYTIYDFCSTDCATTDCTAEQNVTDLFCFAAYTGQFTHTELDGYCGATDQLCIKDNANPCCTAGDQCVSGCSAATGGFCMPDEYRCKAP